MIAGALGVAAAGFGAAVASADPRHRRRARDSRGGRGRAARAGRVDRVDRPRRRVDRWARRRVGRAGLRHRRAGDA
ncbi:hypothetical protein JPH1_32650 [Mycobacterium avium subsp. hominissuis]|uniref:Uncharacterized protein n=1 Tax=Mycobacterium avium subsp. hominissuis TaxID=439334 RepID=A0AAI8SP64_MYCAV|nr:hypothetical protein JPH1_32650 [Mycobacterium avium subsp. hominissuis]